LSSFETRRKPKARGAAFFKEFFDLFVLRGE